MKYFHISVINTRIAKLMTSGLNHFKDFKKLFLVKLVLKMQIRKSLITFFLYFYSFNII